MATPLTFLQLKQTLRSRLWPEGEADNLVEPHDALFEEALKEAQRWVACLRTNNTHIIPACATYFQCGLTVFQKPPGNIARLYVISKVDENGKQDKDGTDDYCSLVEYKQVRFCDVKSYVDNQIACGCCGTITVNNWFGLTGECNKNSFPIPDDVGVKDDNELPMGFHYAQESTDASCGRSFSGVWAIKNDRIYISPWLQSYETIVIEYEGTKDEWNDLDVVPQLDQSHIEILKFVQGYVGQVDAEIYQEDDAKAARYARMKATGMQNLMRDCREANRIRSCQTEGDLMWAASQSQLTLEGQGSGASSTTSTTTTTTTTSTTTTTGTSTTSTTPTTTAQQYNFCVTEFEMLGTTAESTDPNFNPDNIVGEWGLFDWNSTNTASGAEEDCDYWFKFTVDFKTGGRLDRVAIRITSNDGTPGNERWSTNSEQDFPLAIYPSVDPIVQGDRINDDYIEEPFTNANNISINDSRATNGFYTGVVTFYAFGQINISAKPTAEEHFRLEVEARQEGPDPGDSAAGGEVWVYDVATLDHAACDNNALWVRFNCPSDHNAIVGLAIGDSTYESTSNMGGPIDGTSIWNGNPAWDGPVACEGPTDQSPFDIDMTRLGGWYWVRFELVCTGLSDGFSSVDKCSTGNYLFLGQDGGGYDTWGPFEARPGMIIDYNNGSPYLRFAGDECVACGEDKQPGGTPASLPGAPRCLTDGNVGSDGDYPDIITTDVP